MPRLIAWAVLGFVVLPGCLYVVAAKVAISTISGVASEVASGSTTGEPEVPKEKSAILEAYKNCLQQRSGNPRVDCSRYRTALEANAK